MNFFCNEVRCIFGRLVVSVADTKHSDDFIKVCVFVMI